MTENELIAELEAAFAASSQTPGGGGLTRHELEKLLGWPRTKIHQVVRGLCETGAWECVKEYRTSVDGSNKRVPTYRKRVST